MSDEADKIRILDATQSVTVSWLRDAGTFGALVATAYFANVIIPPSGWINFAVAFAWIMWIFGRSQRLLMRMTPDEMRAWLDQTYPRQDGSETFQ